MKLAKIISNLLYHISFVIFFCFASASSIYAAPVTTVVEAEIMQVSQIPDQQKLDYPNCLLAAKIRVNKIMSGPAVSEYCEVLFMLYRDKKIDRQLADVLKEGKKLSLELIDFDLASDDIQSTSQANDLTDIADAQYYAVKTNEIKDFKPLLSPQNFKGSDSYVSPFLQPINPPRPPEIWEKRNARMRQKQMEIDAALKAVQGNTIPDISCGEALKRESIPHQIVELNKKQVAFVKKGNSLFSLSVTDPMREKPLPEYDENYKKLKKINDFLLFHQIEPIFLLLPNFHSVSKRIVFPGMRNIPDVEYYDIAQKMLCQGIEPEIIYPQILDRWAEFDMLYCYTDDNSHPHFGLSEISARTLADLLHATGIEDNNSKTAFKESKRYCFSYPDYIDVFFKTEKYSFPLVLYKDKVPDLNAPESPILILGNSFAGFPRSGAAIGDRIALHSGIVPDLLRSDASGLATIIPKRLLLNSNRYLRGKKFCFIVIYPLFIKYQWPDIEAMDKIYSMITDGYNKTTIYPETLKISGSHEISSIDKLSNGMKKFINTTTPKWRLFFSPKSEKINNRIECFLPQGVDDNTSRLISINVSAQNYIYVSVNAKTQQIYANTDTLLFDLPPKVNYFSISTTPNQVFALGPITIFTPKEPTSK